MTKQKTAEWFGLNKKIRWGRTQVAALSDEVTWRVMLENIGGSRSLGDMNVKNMARVVDHMAREFKIEFANAKTTKKADAPYNAKVSQRRSDFYEIPDGIHAPQKRAICAMWKKLGYDMTSLDTRVKRQCGVETFLWCNDPAYLQKLGRDLEIRLKKKQAKDAKAGA